MKSIGLFLALLSFSFSFASQSVEKKWSVIRGIGIHYVVVDPYLAKLEAIYPSHTCPKKDLFFRENFASMVSEVKPLAAINGTYFDPGSGRPVGGLVRDGKVIFGGLGHSSIVVKTSGKIEIKKDPCSGGIEFQKWDTSVKLAIGTGPLLVTEGKVEENMEDEGYGDPAVFGRGRRSAFGLTKAAKPVLVSIPEAVSLNKMATILTDLGIKEAVNLDGGGSSSLFCEGEFPVLSYRPIPQMIAVFERTNVSL